MSENENEWQKTEPVPILLPRVSPMLKQETKKFDNYVLLWEVPEFETVQKNHLVSLFNNYSKWQVFFKINVQVLIRECIGRTLFIYVGVNHL